MKNKIIKKLMVFGLVFSMSLAMMPVQAMAAGTQTESETKQTESETKQPETAQSEKQQAETKKAEAPQTETKQPETEKKKADSTERETKQTESETKQSETPQGETKQPETPEVVEELLDQPGKTAKATENNLLTVEGGELGTDYTYTHDNNIHIIVIKSKKELKINGAGKSYAGRIEVEAKEAKVTLSGVNMFGNDGAALIVKEGASLNLTLNKKNGLNSEIDDSAAVKLEAGSELTIGGKGQLLIQGNGEERDIYMSRGNEQEEGENKNVPSSLKITDGTITAQAGICAEEDGLLPVSVQITGGSVDLKPLPRKDKKSIKITGYGDKEVHKVSIALNGESEQMDDLTVQMDGSEYTYGNTGIYTNENGKIFLYLPAGQAAVIVSNGEDVEYTGKVEKTTSSENEKETELIKAGAVVSVESVVIPALDYGYDEGNITAVPVVIKNVSVNPAVVKSVQLISAKKDEVSLATSPFTLTTPAELTASVGLTIPGKKENAGVAVKPKEGLTAGTYKATLEITLEGESESKKAEVSFTVHKVKVTPTAKIDKKVYDGKRAATGTVTLKGGVNGETPKVEESKVTYTFNNANVKDANTVTVKNLVLTEEWEKNYELAQTEFKVAAKIKKAPSKYTKADLKTPSVTTVYNKSKGVWQPQLTTYKGQEYLFVKSDSTTFKNTYKRSKNWVYGNKATVKDRLVGMSAGLKAKTTYIVWTRFAEDDNHEASDGEVVAYSTFSLNSTGSATDANGNKINGLVEGTTYKIGSALRFGAVGAGMSNTSPKTGDERYLPVSWKVSEEHTWSSAPYEAGFTINQAGSYTLQVTFRKQTYTNGAWTDTSTTSVAKVNFKMASTGANGTGYTPSSGTTSTTNSTGSTTTANKSVTSTAAKTGDHSPVVPMMVIFLASAVVLAGYGWKKRSRIK